MRPLSREWTAEDRLRAIAALLPQIQEDIYKHRYSEPGRPNITSLQHIIGDDPEQLEKIRKELESAIKYHEYILGRDT